MKRPAAARATPAAKKGRKADPTVAWRKATAEQCKAVSSAILKNKGFPKEVVQMVGHNVTAALSKVQAERHPFQVKIIEMAQAILENSLASLQEGFAAAEAELQQLDSSSANLQADVDAAKQALEAKTAAVEGAKTSHLESVQAVKAGKAAHHAAVKEATAGDADLVAAGDKKTRLEDVLIHIQESLAGALPVASVHALCKVGKELDFDATLLSSLPSALAKTPEDRGNFDNIVIEQAAEEIKKQIQAFAEFLAAGEAGRQARAAKVAVEQEAVTNAEGIENALKEALAAVTVAEKEADDALKKATKALKQLGPETKIAKANLEEAKEKLAHLQEGAIAAFQSLLVLAAPAPEEPAAEPSAEPAAEATAEEAK